MRSTTQNTQNTRNSQNRQNTYGHLRRLGALAGPVYAELLSGVLASVLTAFWALRLGGPAVAAVTLAGTVENLLLGLVLVVASGTGVSLARARGAGDGPAAALTARAAWRLCAVGSLALSLPGLLLREPLAGAFLDGPAAALAADYFAVAFPAFALFFGQRVADELFKGAGDTRTPMRMALLSNALLLLLDPLLILGAGPVPALGVPGAALALALSRAVALAVTLRLRPRATAPGAGTGSAAAGIVRAGLPFGLDFTARMAVGTAQLALTAGFGVAAVAGYGLGYRLLLVATMAFYALRQAAAIEAARLAGAGAAEDLHDLRRATRWSALLAGGGAALLAAAAAVPLTALFTGDQEVAGQSVLFLRTAAPYLLPYALVVALGGLYQGMGASRPVVLSVLVGLGAQLAASVALSGPLGVTGVWAGPAVGAVVQLAVLGRAAPAGVAAPVGPVCHSDGHDDAAGRAGGATRSRR